LDIAFVLDTSGSMYEEIQGSKRFIKTAAERVQKLNGRVSLVVFKDACDTYPAKLLLNLTTDIKQLEAALEPLTAGGGCEIGEGSYHGAMVALDNLHWKNGATKAMVLITDEPPANPDRTDHSTAKIVAARALEIDPVNVYPVESEMAVGQFSEIAKLTSGQVVSGSDTASALDVVFDKLEQRPEPILSLARYEATLGQSIYFDASSTKFPDNSIALRYEWDVNGDGKTDATTQTPVLDYTYPKVFEGRMSVTVFASNGTLASASAEVSVHQAATVKPGPDAPTDPEVMLLNDNQMQVTWLPSATGETATRWMISDGGTTGTTETATSQIVYEMLPEQNKVELAISAVAANDEVSAPLRFVLKRAGIEDVETPTENMTATPSPITNIAALRTLGVTQQNPIARRDSGSSEQAAPEITPTTTTALQPTKTQTTTVKNTSTAQSQSTQPAKTPMLLFAIGGGVIFAGGAWWSVRRFLKR
jgi:hypothetical protein